MDRQSAIDTLREYLSCWRTDSGNAMITPDFLWENFLPKHVPFGGSYKGTEGLSRYQRELAASWETGAFVFERYVFDQTENSLIAIGYEENGRSTITGRLCDMPFVFEARFTDDGRLSYFREYNDTAAIGATFDQ